MEVTGLCLHCNKRFDAHWHNFEGVVMCPYCKTEERRFISISTDEDLDYVEDNEYDMED